MRGKARKVTFVIQAGVVLVMLIGAVGVFIEAETKPMSRDELKIEAANLRSLASGGRQLFEQFLGGQTTETFFQTQSSLLRDRAKEARKNLDSSDAETGLELKHWQARHLAKQVEDALARFNDKSSDASQTRDELTNLFTQLKELEDSLKQ